MLKEDWKHAHLPFGTDRKTALGHWRSAIVCPRRHKALVCYSSMALSRVLGPPEPHRTSCVNSWVMGRAHRRRQRQHATSPSPKASKCCPWSAPKALCLKNLCPLQRPFSVEKEFLINRYFHLSWTFTKLSPLGIRPVSKMRRIVDFRMRKLFPTVHNV